MKKLNLLIAAIVTGLAALTPAKAEARDFCGGTRITHDSCGSTVYWEYVRVGFDCHGCPVFRWVVVRTVRCDIGFRPSYPVYPCRPSFPHRPHCHR